MAFLDAFSSPFKERAKSPFYATFVVSWVIWNWKIFIALFFFTENDRGGLNIVDYIMENYICIHNILIYPIIISVVYIFGVSWVDYGVSVYSEWMQRKKIDEKIRIGRLHNVTGDVFYNLKNQFEKEKKKLLVFETERSQVDSKLMEFENRVKELIDNKTLLEEQLLNQNESISKFRQRSDLTVLFNGRWKITITDETISPNTANRTEKEDVFIGQNKYSVISDNLMTIKYELDLIDYDHENKTLNFLKKPSRNADGSIGVVGRKKEGEFIICRLNRLNRDRFEGYENQKKVTYVREERNDLIGLEEKDKKTLVLNIPIGNKELVNGKIGFLEDMMYWKTNIRKTDYITLIVEPISLYTANNILESLKEVGVNFIDEIINPFIKQ